MKQYLLTSKKIDLFRKFLAEEEKSKSTIEKYIRDIKYFLHYSGSEISKEKVIEYKHQLTEKYAVRSVNSIIASMNAFFTFAGWNELKVKALKIQQQIYRPEEKELTKAEYFRLCRTAERNGNLRLSLIIQTICGTGIRVSELEFITVESVRYGEAEVNCKGKRRTIFIVKDLQRKLMRYARENKILTGCIFVTRTGKPVSRTNIWREMKNLCIEAEVNPTKVYPHNLRHLFARVFYAIEKDIAKLADVLGHSNINTTRIYIISTGSEHKNRMEKMRLII